MPLISPPTDEEPEPATESQPVNTAFRDRWIKWFLDCPNWICPVCQATNFGRNKYCGYCHGRNGIKTLRPDWYKENTYAEVYFGPKDGR
jgi:hypothetical protein